MMRTLMIAAVLAGALAANGAIAQAGVQRLDISMSNFKFSPSTIHMQRGASYALTLHNEASGGHSFEAPEFFATAQMPSADRARVAKGEIEVAGGEQITVTVSPGTSGTYRFHCGHLLHSTFGMSGSIVVD